MGHYGSITPVQTHRRAVMLKQDSLSPICPQKAWIFETCYKCIENKKQKTLTSLIRLLSHCWSLKLPRLCGFGDATFEDILAFFWRWAGEDLQFNFSGLSGDVWLDSGEDSGWSTPGPSQSRPLETPLCVESVLLEGEPSPSRDHCCLEDELDNFSPGSSRSITAREFKCSQVFLTEEKLLTGW